MSERYVAATGRYSFKRDGRHGVSWSVIDKHVGGLVAYVENEAEAKALAGHLNGGGDRPTTRRALLDIVGQVR